MNIPPTKRRKIRRSRGNSAAPNPSSEDGIERTPKRSPFGRAAVLSVSAGASSEDGIERTPKWGPVEDQGATVKGHGRLIKIFNKRTKEIGAAAKRKVAGPAFIIFREMSERYWVTNGHVIFRLDQQCMDRLAKVKTNAKIFDRLPKIGETCDYSAGFATPSRQESGLKDFIKGRESSYRQDVYIQPWMLGTPEEPAYLITDYSVRKNGAIKTMKKDDIGFFSASYIHCITDEPSNLVCYGHKEGLSLNPIYISFAERPDELVAVVMPVRAFGDIFLTLCEIG